MSGTVLIAGASGVIGEAAVEHFARLPGWNVIAVSRRAPAEAHPTVRHVPIDLTDRGACAASLRELGALTHVVYAAVSERPGLVEGWRDPAQMALNLAMLQNLLDPLCEVARDLRHVSLLQGAKAYGAHAGHLAPVPARERAARVEHENFYWLQEDCLRAKSARHGLAFTIWRPCVVIGSAVGAAMNPLLALGAYAAIRREEGLPFSYPGGALQVSEIVGADLVAEALAWAAVTPTATCETFNITNGDVFAWCEAWPVLADAFGVAPGPDEPRSLAAYLGERAGVWGSIAGREGLGPKDLIAYLGESHHYADILLRRDTTTISRPNLLSTIRLRQAGFHACRDSEDSLRHWIMRLQARRSLPRLTPSPLPGPSAPP